MKLLKYEVQISVSTYKINSLSLTGAVEHGADGAHQGEEMVVMDEGLAERFVEAGH